MPIINDASLLVLKEDDLTSGPLGYQPLHENWFDPLELLETQATTEAHNSHGPHLQPVQKKNLIKLRTVALCPQSMVKHSRIHRWRQMQGLHMALLILCCQWPCPGVAVWTPHLQCLHLTTSPSWPRESHPRFLFLQTADFQTVASAIHVKRA